MKKILGRTLALAGGPLFAATLFVAPANAAPALNDPPPISADEPLSAIQALSPESLETTAAAVSTTDSAAAYSTEGASVTVPWDASHGAVVAGDHVELRVQLPFAEQTSNGVVLESGVTAFDNGNASKTVPVAHEDGSLQILTVIESANAPTRYDYEISVPEGGAMTVIESGVVLITDAAGKFVGGVAPAWARDAAGNELSTSYEVKGNTLTQVIDHSAAVEYPVVADPWLGIKLFQNFSRTKEQGDWRYGAWVTPLGAVILGGGGGVGGYVAGQAVFRGAGWDEWKAIWSEVSNKPTLQQQYNCHVAASVYGLPFTQDYNLERFRANRDNWVNGIQSHHCNW